MRLKALEVLWKSALDNSTRICSHCLLLSHQNERLLIYQKLLH